jgi:translation initiation factor IF-3
VSGPFSRGGPSDKPRTRVNERIRVPQVRVIDAEGQQVGIMDTREALAAAREKGLDLVEVSPTSRPPVCRIMDFGKFKYEEAKKQRVAKKKQHSFLIKEVKLRPKIDDHDFEVKLAATRKFLDQHHKVKLTIMFRGREMAHPELGERVMNRILAEIPDMGIVEHAPKLEGRNLSTVVGPRPAKVVAKPRPRPAEEDGTPAQAGTAEAALEPAQGEETGAGA